MHAPCNPCRQDECPSTAFHIRKLGRGRVTASPSAMATRQQWHSQKHRPGGCLRAPGDVPTCVSLPVAGNNENVFSPILEKKPQIGAVRVWLGMGRERIHSSEKRESVFICSFTFYFPGYDTVLISTGEESQRRFHF